MIEAIKEIGEYSLDKKCKNIDNLLDVLDVLIDDPESNPKNPSYKKILLILIKEVNGEYAYTGVDIEEYSKDKLTNYLYKKGNSKDTDITPTSRITTLESTFKNTKILPWFNDYNEIGQNEEINFLVKIGNCIRDSKERILDDLKAKHGEIDKKEKSVITLKIDGKYIGEYDIFKKILIEESKRGFYSKYGVESKAEGETCFVCNQPEKDVYGFVDTYKFYTVDKPGFVSGGFQQKDAWKVYPVCLNCALTLEAGKKYLHDKLSFNFYGFNYHLIPKFIIKADYEVKKTFFSLIEGWRDPKFDKEGRKEFKRLTQDEKGILEEMSMQENYLNMNFMFYEAPKGYDGSVFNILLYIEDILPTRLRKLFDIKREIDKINISKECMVPVFENKKKVGEKPLEFNFGLVRTFFPKISNNRTYDKYFLDIVNKIFTNKPVDHDFLMKFIMQKIREEFVNDYPTKISTLKGFMLLNYLNKLNILKTNKNDMYKPKMETTTSIVSEKDISEESNELKQKIDAFFEEFADFFDSNVKKAIFLEGVLAQRLLNIQRLPEVSNAKPGKEPFRPKLKGLKLNEKQITKLLPEIQNKLEEYGKNYYRNLESIISNYFVSAGNGWKLTNDEISFYFVLGMNLSDKLKSKKDEEDNKNDNE